MDATRLHQKVRIPGVLEISLLGSPAICQNGERVPRLERHPQKLALLAYLCTQPAGRTTSRDTLLGLFWPEAATAQARRGLSQALHFLTSQLGEVVERTGSQRLALGDAVDSIDTRAFDRATAEQRWADAAALYRGELLEGVVLDDCQPGQEWLENARADYRGRAINALWSAAAEAARGGHASAALEQATRAIRLDPMQEEQCAAVVEALIEKAEHGSALAIIAELERAIEQATGDAPSADWSVIRARIVAARKIEPVLSHAEVHRAPTDVKRRMELTPHTGWQRGARGVTIALFALACLALGKLVVTQSARANTATTAALAVLSVSMTGDSGLARTTMNALVHALQDSVGVTVLVPGGNEVPSAATYRLEAGLIGRGPAFALSYQLRHVKSGLVLGSGRTADGPDPLERAVEVAFRVSGDIDQFQRLAPLRSADPEAVARWNSAVGLQGIADSLRAAGAFREAIEQYAVADSVYEAAAKSEPLHLIATLARTYLFDARAVAAMMMGGTAEAVRSYNTAIDLASNLLEEYGDRMEVYQARAIVRYHQWMVAPVSRDSARQLLDRAESDLRVALRFNPNDAVTLNTISGVLFAEGRYTASHVYAQKAWEKRSYRIDPRELLNRLFLASFNAYDDRSARTWCGELRGRYPGEWSGATCTLMLMAWAPDVPPDPEVGWDIVKTGLSREPQHVRTAFEPRLTLLMAAILARAGKPSASLATVKSVDESGDVQLLGFKAAALLSLADTAGARVVAERYSNSHPVTRDALASARIYKGLSLH